MTANAAPCYMHPITGKPMAIAHYAVASAHWLVDRSLAYDAIRREPDE